MNNKKYRTVLFILMILLVMTTAATGVIVAFSYARQTRMENEAARQKEQDIRDKRHNDKARADKEIEESMAAKEAREAEAAAKAEKRRKELEEEEKARQKAEKKETDKSGEKSSSDETKKQKENTSANGYTVCIDPGHQERGDSSTEPIGPGASEEKAKVTDGATGVSGVPEHQLNLTIGMLLKEELEKRGYQVVMTRTSADVNISNKERAEMANNAGADITIRLHADASDGGATGASVLAPSSGNPYVANLSTDSHRLGNAILDNYCSQTGFKNRGVIDSDNMTGINWCKMPVALLEMGFLDNSSDDAKLQDSSLQPVMASSIADGVDDYFGR